MKCTHCGFIQADGRTACGRCGRASGESHAGPAAPPNAGKAKRRRLSKTALNILVVLLLVDLMVHRPRPPEPGEAVSAYRRPIAVRPVLRALKFLGLYEEEDGERAERRRDCVRTKEELGAPTDLAIDLCFEGDEEGAQEFRRASAARRFQPESVAAADVGAVDLMLKAAPVVPGAESDKLDLYLVLRDADGRSVSSRGVLAVELQPNVGGNSRAYQIEEGMFRPAIVDSLPEGPVLAMHLDTIRLPRKDLQGVELIAFKAVFDGHATGDASLRIHPSAR